jgi:hypothetical protein
MPDGVACDIVYHSNTHWKTRKALAKSVEGCRIMFGPLRISAVLGKLTNAEVRSAIWLYETKISLT